MAMLNNQMVNRRSHQAPKMPPFSILLPFLLAAKGYPRMVRPMPRARGAMRQGMAKLAEPKAALRCGPQPGREQQGPMAPRTVVAIAYRRLGVSKALIALVIGQHDTTNVVKHGKTNKLKPAQNHNGWD